MSDIEPSWKMAAMGWICGVLFVMGLNIARIAAALEKLVAK